MKAGSWLAHSVFEKISASNRNQRSYQSMAVSMSGNVWPASENHGQWQCYGINGNHEEM